MSFLGPGMADVPPQLKDRAGKLGQRKRLGVFGHGNFRADHRVAHELMDRLGIIHEYNDGPRRQHDWHSGWVEEAGLFVLPYAELRAAPDPEATLLEFLERTYEACATRLDWDPELVSPP